VQKNSQVGETTQTSYLCIL